MRARFALVEAILKIKTFNAIQSALDHLRDMLRLCRSDNMGVRDLVPALFLRLGRDQESYDFVKWYATAGQASDYDWGDMSLPFLNVANADVFEPVDYMCGKYLNLSHTVAVTLLKIKVLLDLKDLQNSTQLDKIIPQEVVDNIKRPSTDHHHLGRQRHHDLHGSCRMHREAIIAGGKAVHCYQGLQPALLANAYEARSTLASTPTDVQS